MATRKKAVVATAFPAVAGTTSEPGPTVAGEIVTTIEEAVAGATAPLAAIDESGVNMAGDPPADLASYVAEDIRHAREMFATMSAGLSVRSASQRGRRRAGMGFGPVAQVVDPAGLDDAQLIALVTDLELVCVPVPLGTDAD